jgi:hypothetical protein
MSFEILDCNSISHCIATQKNTLIFMSNVNFALKYSDMTPGRRNSKATIDVHY